MTHKNFFTISSGIFSIITVLHLTRIIYGWSAVVGGWQVPLWVSWIAVLVAGYLAYTALTFSKRT